MAEEMIKACPFCGGKKVDIARTNPGACWVQCDTCYGQTRSRKSRRGAINAWNRRVLTDVTAVIIYDMDKGD